MCWDMDFLKGYLSRFCNHMFFMNEMLFLPCPNTTSETAAGLNRSEPSPYSCLSVSHATYVTLKSFFHAGDRRGIIEGGDAVKMERVEEDA